MSTREKLTHARVSMLALADELQNISRACKVAGISRSHFCDVKEAFERYGREGLAPHPRRRPRIPNQTPPELEQQILAMTKEYPTYSYVKIADQLKLAGVPASASAVRGVGLRQGLLKKYDRLLEQPGYKSRAALSYCRSIRICVRNQCFGKLSSGVDDFDNPGRPEREPGNKG